MDQFNNVLSIQESKLEKYLEDLEKNEPSNSKKDYQKSEKLAQKYLDDGDSYIKTHKYTLAAVCFQEGLHLDYPNKQLRVELLNNLSATQFLLDDYRYNNKIFNNN